MIKFFATAESGAPGGAVSLGIGTSIVTSPALAGSRSYKVDPVAVGSTYGCSGRSGLPATPKLLNAGWLFQNAANFNQVVALLELHTGSLGEATRKLSMNANNRLQLFDDDDNVIGQTADNFIVNNTTYPILYHLDQRSLNNTRDIVYVYKSGAWVKAIDVANHGEGNHAVSQITWGTGVGKNAPTSGGPYYIDNMFLQYLDEKPNDTPIASITGKYKAANGNGSFGNFNTGTGTNPDFNDVDEINSDNDTTYDEGDVAGDKQSYAITNADTGDNNLLAVQVIGASGKTGSGFTVHCRAFLYNGSVQDNGASFDPTASYSDFSVNFGYKIWNTFNGAAITKTVFDALQAGIEITAIDTGGHTIKLSQIGLEYCLEGTYALPSGFPDYTPIGKIRQLKQAVKRASYW